MKQHAQENAPASVQHFYPPLLPVTLSSSTFRSIFVPASSFCRLIDASVHLVYKREDRIGDDFIVDIFFFILIITLFIFKFSIYRYVPEDPFVPFVSKYQRFDDRYQPFLRNSPIRIPDQSIRNLSTIIGRSIIRLTIQD